MSIEKIWVLAEVSGGSPVTTSLELLTAARSLASVTEAVTWGPDSAVGYTETRRIRSEHRLRRGRSW